ncbi:hypothetical protein EDB85DRAFT_295396 [Lactarius pseudohatsudake]|nr:hypothetical protein EDB85DRAFT_295396 [Lactarius pseudohatsudake]
MSLCRLSALLPIITRCQWIYLSWGQCPQAVGSHLTQWLLPSPWLFLPQTIGSGMSEIARRWRWGNGKRVGVNCGDWTRLFLSSRYQLLHFMSSSTATWCLPVWVLHPRNSCTRVCAPTYAS